MYMLIIRNAKLFCYFLRCFPNITRKILIKIHCFINSNLNKDKACVTYKYFKPSIRKFKCKNYFKFIRIFKSTFFYENHGKTYFLSHYDTFSARQWDEPLPLTLTHNRKILWNERMFWYSYRSSVGLINH